MIERYDSGVWVAWERARKGIKTESRQRKACRRQSFRRVGKDSTAGPGGGKEQGGWEHGTEGRGQGPWHFGMGMGVLRSLPGHSLINGRQNGHHRANPAFSPLSSTRTTASLPNSSRSDHTPYTTVRSTPGRDIRHAKCPLQSRPIQPSQGNAIHSSVRSTGGAAMTDFLCWSIHATKGWRESLETSDGVASSRVQWVGRSARQGSHRPRATMGQKNWVPKKVARTHRRAVAIGAAMMECTRA